MCVSCKSFKKSFKSLRKFNSLLSRKSRNFLAIKESFVKCETMESCSCYAPIKKPLSNLYTVYTLGQLAPTIFNIIHWVAGMTVSLTKHLMIQVSFFFIIPCKILCKNPFNSFFYFFITLQK